MTLEQKTNAKGYVFILPFIIGFVFFFAYPIIQTVFWSFCDVNVQGSISVNFNSIQNYIYALRKDANFFKLLYSSVGRMLIQLPLILIFSFVMANFLKPKFHGRNIIRLIFFMPVVLTSGVVATIEKNTLITELEGLVTVSQIQEFLLDMNFPAFLAQYISDAVDGISLIVNNSGIQILLFLAALQSISPSIYESASIEGATAWESFWKITFPMVLPQVVVAMVYTIVSLFISSNNEVVSYIQDMSFGNLKFGISSAMSMVYTLIIVIVLAVFVGTTTYATKKYGE